MNVALILSQHTFQCGPMIDISKMFLTETSLGTW